MLRVRQLNTAALSPQITARALMRSGVSSLAVAAASITAPPPSVNAMKAELDRLDPEPSPK